MSSLPSRKNDVLNKIRQGKIKSSSNKSRRPKRLNKGQIAKTIANTSLPKLLMAIDATASRERCWSVAQEITEGMFLAVPKELEIGLAYHGGSKVREITSFTTDKKKFAEKIRSVRCLAGQTALNDILDLSSDINRLRVIVYVGDRYEENINEALGIVSSLALKGVRLFFFHDTSDAEDQENLPYDLQETAKAFQTLAETGRGAVFPFDANSPEIIKSILEALAYYSSRGIEALKQLNTPGALKLLSAIKD
ncbi:MAG: hypothetical protein AAFQ80_21335 [Cyanobacteria bacterium J06621_8]